LLEMVVVLGIIALILGAAITYSKGIGEAARYTATEAKIKECAAKLEAYRLGAGHYPTTEQGLGALVAKPGTGPQPKRWTKQMQSVPKDGWEAEFVYRNPGKRDDSTYEIVSMGGDGKMDTEDDVSSQEVE
jgi:general secretion pathway protein G